MKVRLKVKHRIRKRIWLPRCLDIIGSCISNGNEPHNYPFSLSVSKADLRMVRRAHHGRDGDTRNLHYLCKDHECPSSWLSSKNVTRLLWPLARDEILANVNPHQHPCDGSARSAS